MRQKLFVQFAMSLLVATTAVAGTKSNSIDPESQFTLSLSKNRKSRKFKSAKSYLSTSTQFEKHSKELDSFKPKGALKDLQTVDPMTDGSSYPEYTEQVSEAQELIPSFSSYSEITPEENQFAQLETTEAESMTTATTEIQEAPTDIKTISNEQVTAQPLQLDTPQAPADNTPVIDPRYRVEEASAAVITVSDSSAQAEGKLSTSVSNENYPSEFRDRGIRIAVLKPNLNITVQTQLKDLMVEPTRAESKLDTTGFSTGYIYMPIRSLGWSANAAFLQTKDSGGDATIGRIDANVGMAVNDSLNFKGGFNGSRFLSGHQISQLQPGIGIQGSIGLRVYKNVGIDIGYVEMSQGGEIESNGQYFNMITYEKGLDLSLHTTF